MILIFENVISLIGSLLRSEIMIYPVGAAVVCSLGFLFYEIITGRG